ncbi:MAG: ribosome recycling factor [Firmicutes bacterium]|nr:ribosome recycling factor [Bacillota bacterium]
MEDVATKLAAYEQRLQKALDFFRSEMNGIRAGRANPHLLDKIVVDYYGTPTPLSQMANISVPEARTLLVSVWDVSALKEVSKAIQSSDLGINPSDDGKVIRLSFPQLTAEKRKDLVKQIKKIGEESKVVLRNERRDCMESFKKMQKDGLLTEDDLADCEKDVQKALDKYIVLLDGVLKEKEKELLEL